jgi:hypothetical protein
MKHCCKCKQNLSLESFTKNKSKSDGLQTQCKTCKKITDAKHFQENKTKQLDRNAKFRKQNIILISNYKKSLGCKFCNEKDPVCLDFHHLSDKKFCISNKIGCYSWQNLLLEIKKCEVVCSNCHRKLHAKQNLLPIR